MATGAHTEVPGVKAPFPPFNTETFASQLLCEQVVGRGLRRSSYDDLSQAEFVDVYGIPFQAIPVQEVKATTAKPPPDVRAVRALAERAALEIVFPRVTGYLTDIREQVTADIAGLPYLKVSPTAEPTQITASAPVGQMAGIMAVAPRVMHERRSSGSAVRRSGGANCERE